MKLIELILDENEFLSGINAISLVEYPAIEEEFIALNSDRKIEFATQSEEKRLLMGAALVPNKPIYRKEGGEEFYVYFTKETIRRASEMFFQNGNQNNSTLEHEVDLKGLSVVESWIIEDEEYDKSRKYGLNLPIGTWMVSMKVNNPEVWEGYVKNGKVKGFSIEGYFVDKVNMSKEVIEAEEQEAIEILYRMAKVIYKELKRWKTNLRHQDHLLKDQRGGAYVGTRTPTQQNVVMDLSGLKGLDLLSMSRNKNVTFKQ